MKIVTNLEEANLLLQSYIGSKSQLWMFSRSLKRLAIRLESSSENEVIYIIGIGCDYISGYLNWKNANLFIEVVHNKNANEYMTRIVDESAGFELITSGGFSLAKGAESDFGTSFENFISNKM